MAKKAKAQAMKDAVTAEVVAVHPNKVKIAVVDLDSFKIAGEKLSVGSYLRVSDSEDCAIIAIIDNYTIEAPEGGEKRYVIEATPIGFLDADGVFHRGGTNIAIPPIAAGPARRDEIRSIYAQIEAMKRFSFCSLSQDSTVPVHLDGDRLFGKHIAIVGSTGSGKSCTLASLLQKAVAAKASGYTGMNNSHIILFDLHGEYRDAFPGANCLDIDNLVLPYWMMNGEELEELFVEHGENQAYNQVSLLRRIVTRNKQLKNANDDLTFDSPAVFSIQEVVKCIVNLSRETRNSKKPDEMRITGAPQEFACDEDKYAAYFSHECAFEETKQGSVSKGTYNDGTLEKFVSRLRNKTGDARLAFLLGPKSESISFEQALRQFMGYQEDGPANVTVIDLSGVPFEALSITVSLVSRLVFEFGYRFRRSSADGTCKAPLLLVYEEGHKYVPRSEAARYGASRYAIERVAKEGRKYGVTLVIVSQRPAEISETIFSQCGNFIAMRLTNPEDQNYVRRLLPDAMGPLTDELPSLESGEALLIGDATVMPSIVKVDMCNPTPSSSDVPFLQEWRKKWHDIKFAEITSAWK